MLKLLKGIGASISAIVASLVIFGGNIDKLSQMQVAGPVAMALQVAKPEIVIISLACLMLFLFGHDIALLLPDVAAIKRERKWLIPRLRYKALIVGLSVFIFGIIACYQGYFYAKGKFIAWTYKGQAMVGVADKRFASGNFQGAKSILEYCSNTLGSNACKRGLNDLLKRQSASIAIDRLRRMVSFGPELDAAFIIDQLQITNNVAEYDAAKQKLIERVRVLNQKFATALVELHQADFAGALAHLESINTEAPGYRDVQRFIDETKRVMKRSPSSVADQSDLPYVFAATKLDPSDMAKLLELSDPAMPAANGVLFADNDSATAGH